MAYETNTISRLFLSGWLLALLPMLVALVLGGMVHNSWIPIDFDALDMILWGILLPISFFGVGLFAVSLYMANKNRNERD